MSEHSVVGASSMYRWSACPGSVKMCEGLKSLPSKYADEGTFAHSVAADMIMTGCWDKTAPPEMIEYLKIYVDTVEELVGDKFIEHKFDLSSLFPGMFGTADCVVYNKKTKVLSVLDLKYGAGIAVEVENSQQLQFYALGALMSLGFPCETVEVIIVQPRCPHPDGAVRRWSFPAIDLLDFAADAVEAAKKTQEPNAKLVAGDHCRFCGAAGFCSEIKKQALAKAKEQFSQLTPYDPKTLSEVLTWLPTLESWVKSVREFAYTEFQHGRPIPGYKLVAKRATRKWKMDDAEIAKALGDSPDLWDKSLKSPAQMEKLLGKNAVAELCESISSGLTLAEESDKRPAAKPDASAEFTRIE